MEAKNCKRNLKNTNNFNTVAKSVIITLLVLIFKLENCEYCDYTEYFGNGYYYRDEGGDIKEIFGSKAHTPGIPPTVIDFDYNRDFIIAKQKPKLPLDILYDVNYLYKDEVDTFYWIISVKNYFGLGPLDKQEYEAARKKYGVPNKLKLE